MKAHRKRGRVDAFTLPEVMVGMAVSAFMFAAILTATVAFQRSFSGAMNYSRGTTDQQRALDYVARDLRRAYTVTVSQFNQTLTVTVPDYYTAYDSQGNPTGTPVTPIITNGKVNYGDTTKPITIVYYLSGGQLFRQQTIGATGTTSTQVVADSVETLQSSFADLTSVVTYTVTFAPNLTGFDRSSTQARTATVLTGSTSVRNARRN
jgi:prepilin-type N-terminal cleavage/methylation domain-containing protein